MEIALVQICAGTDQSANLAKIETLVTQAAKNGANLVGLPEFSTCYGKAGQDLIIGARSEGEHEALKRLQDMAKQNQVELLAGSVAISTSDGRCYNRSHLIGSDGKIRAFYDKIHLFDVDLAGGESYKESDTIAPGGNAILGELEAGVKLGLTICYDVRFSRLYRELALRGAQIIAVPAAFTKKTGMAHWHVLLRARAIETASFVIAPAQCGEAPDGHLKRYGHSLIVDPWGNVLADGGDEEGLVTASLDLSLTDKAKAMVPGLKNERAFS